MKADFTQRDLFESEKKSPPITFAIFCLLEVKQEIQLMLKGRSIHKSVNTKRQECLGSVLGAAYPRNLALNGLCFLHMKYRLTFA